MQSPEALNVSGSITEV